MKKFVLSLLVLLAWAGSSQAQYTLPFTETFPSYDELPLDWVSWQSAGTGDYWVATFGMGGVTDGCAYSWYDGTIWLISKSITVPAGGSVDISFYQKDGNPSSYFKHGLYYSTTGESFVGEWTAINADLGAGPENWTLSPTYTLTGYAGTTVYIAWEFEGSYLGGWYVDNFHMEVTPQCLTPVGVNATGITVSSATLNWTAPSSPPSNGYDIYYSTSSTPPTSSTVPTATVGAGITTYSMVSLSANTVYYAWVRSNCGGSSASWTSVYSFATLCNAVTVLPFNEGFESGYTDQTSVGGCWTQFGGAWGKYWTANSSETTFNRGPRTGSWDATLGMYGDTWMFRKFTLTGGMYYTVSCWAQQNGSTPSYATIELKYGTVDTPGGMTGAIQSPTGLTTSYTQISGSFAPATTGDYYIGIHGWHNSYPHADYITLDDIQVSQTYSCFPPTAITASAICQTSASIAWTPPASAPSGGYDIYYSTSSTAPTMSTPPTASVAAGVTAYTMTPLTLGTTYYVWVRSNCGSGNLSMWSTVYSFSTHSTVPTAITVPGTYPNLTGVGGAFEAINCGVLSGNTIISITADLIEPGTYALNAWTENPSGSNYTLLIKPDASTLRTISGTLTYSASTPALIRTNGASRVTIDGQSGKYLTFRNTTATPATTAGTILFDNSSQNCYLKNSTIEGNYNSTSYGTVTVGNTGNNSVEISGNDVRDATAGTTGIPNVGIYCASQTSSWSVLNNNVYNFNTYGILMITAANGALISGNSIFYNSSTPPTGSQYGIYTMSATFNHLITGNYIGGQAPLCQGSAWTYPGTGHFAGIYAFGTDAGPLTVSNNMIRNIAMSSSGASNFYGIYIGTGPLSVMNNTVGSETVAGSISYAGTNTFYGLYLASVNTSNAVENNIFGNWSLTAASGSPTAYGMLVNYVNARKNKIFNISATNAALTPTIYGIFTHGQYSTTVNEYSNNIISLDAGAASNPVIYGFYNDGYTVMTLKLYYNDIHISGPPTTTSSTYAFCNYINSGLEFKNNIFANLRSPGGTGKHSVLYILDQSSMNIDYNDLYTVAGPLIYYYGTTYNDLAAWKTATGQDAHSITTDPLFVSSTDLHPRQPLLVAGTPVTGVTTDYAGITRATIPTMGAYELTQVATTAATSVTLTGATLNGTVNACSQTVVTSFEYGLTTAYGSSVAATPSPVTGTTSTAITATLSGLTPNSIYHYRAVGTVGSANYYGADMTFSLLPPCSAPTAITATAIAQTSASIAWTPPSSAPASGYDIYYSTSSTPPTISTTPTASVAAGVTTYTMTPLTLGTTYYVWVRSNCGSGNLSAWSTVFSFSTHGIIPTTFTVPGTYPNLTGVGGAFEAINCGGLNGNTTINITADLTEPGTYALNAWAENPAGSNYTLLIKPSASTLRTISGTLTYSASQPALIRTNGASRFTIDGQAGKYLTFRNTTATPSTTAGTIQFNNGSQNCYLKNSTVESNYSAFAYGTVTIGNTGNNSVEISGNDLRDATTGTTGIPGVGIFCNNSLSSLNILNNNIYNYNLIGIYILSAANGAVISGNSLYYNSSTAPATGQWGIYLLSAAFNHLVTGNYIGGQAPLCQGNAWTCPSGGNFEGIYATGTNAGPITISNNMISNIAMTGSGAPAFYGIKIVDGRFNIMNNIVGSETVAGSITYAGTGNIYGLYLASVNTGNAVENNIFGNWSLTAATGSPKFCGIYVYSMNARKNKIFNISASNAALTPEITGIWQKSLDVGTNEYSNNLISLDGGSATNAYITGFANDGNNSGMTLKFYYNDIHISGSPTGTQTSIAFDMWTYNNIELKNNIFSNVRGSGTSSNYVLFFVNHGTLTSDYNDFYTATGPFSYYNSANQGNLAGWKTATGRDAHSLSTDPLFVSSADLHPRQPLLVAGTPVSGITTDYAGITRASVPTIGAYEMPQVTTLAATSVTQTAAVMNGTVNACAQTVVTSFEYGLTTSYGSSVAATPSPVTGNTATGITAALSGLTPNSLYHYRAVGTVGATNYYGADMTFSLLPPCSAPTAVTATAICQTSASIAWTPPASAPASGYDIYYSTSSTPPTLSTTPTASVATGVTAYTMTPLTLGTTYYVWVRSNCGGGDLSMWSTVYSFSTHSPVPTAATVPGTYPNLTGAGGAFEAINCDGLNGNTTISITADLTEPGTIALNGWTENPSGSNYTLLIKPDASTLRTISGTLTWSASLPALIRTNGASRFTIDGEAGKYLTFRNTTATPSGTAGTILFNNSSQNCYLKNSTIENNCSSTSYGTVTIGNTGTNSVEISGNDVRDATAGTTGIPGVGIYCASQTSSLSILNNNVYNFNSYGILMITAANGALISGNSIFYNSSTPPTGSQYGIYLMPSTFNHLLTGNYIGGQAPLCQGNAWTYPGTGSFAGIYASGPYAGLITISNNIIRNIAMTSSGTSNFYGLKTGTGLFSIKNNTVGSESVAGSVTYAGTGEVYGLYFTSTNSSNAVENNIFGNWSLTAATGHPVACGMLVNSVNAVKNKIFNISASNATLTPKIYGIWGLGANGDVNEYSNNIISLDAGAATNPIIYGFYNEAYYNSALKFYYKCESRVKNQINKRGG